MPKITINGRECEFKPGQMILQVANDHGVEIPQYCYHDGLSIVASCRICLAEIHAPDPKSGQVVPFMGGKLMPTCQTPAAEGMVVYADSPKAVANQKAVMEYLLINHPLDCPVCDQSGECFLQDYSYAYGRSVSRFEEQKVKQPKKDLGPHVYLYADRCIMCTRCVRFTREVTGSAELLVQGRGNKEEIDVFPGLALDNELASNVIDLCPVGALLDKDFLFTQRVWFLKGTSSIDGLTASGDNIRIDHNEGKIYRVKPRTNPQINKWWISDEVRYGWKFVHSDQRILAPTRKQFGTIVECDHARAYDEAISGIRAAGGRLAVLVSPMLSCEDAFLLAKAARQLDPQAMLAVGPVPTHGQDRIYPAGATEEDPKAFKIYAEKAPNARGVRRVLSAFGGDVTDFAGFVDRVRSAQSVILTGNYPSVWSTPSLESAIRGKFVVLIDTLASALSEQADIVLPGATWTEKSGSFENAKGIIQAFDQAIPCVGLSKSEGQMALDLIAVLGQEPVVIDGARAVMVESTPAQVAAGTEVLLPRGRAFNAANCRSDMASFSPELRVFATDVRMPPAESAAASDMQVVEI
jgi:NADH-quinone oxidoreductase subunit G